jgi:UDPglucose--hexose-1-phosphate uridylyltransferase
VVCFDPRHHLSINDLSLAGVTDVFKAWQAETAALAARQDIRYALIFENKGDLCGVSSPHPHCQIYATDFIFENIRKELESIQQWRKEKNENLFDALLAGEEKAQSRLVAANDYAVAFVPFFARYPFEVWVFPRKRVALLDQLEGRDLRGLAAIYQQVTRRYDLHFRQAAPYVMSLYQAPLDGGDYGDYHLHFVFLPPLRNPAVQKFPAGPEIGGGNFMCDTLPENAAEQLRAADLETFVPSVWE